jgi:cyclopropane fatty-acyl-phospholipid synthase-like methyltransferase
MTTLGEAFPWSAEAYPRSAAYSRDWAVENLMGPNALWLVESLTQVLPLQPGMRVLDLGCGKGLTSVFLAKEFGLEVWATDLWIGATDNLGRFEAAGVANRVFPIHAEAHALPFAHGFFDAIVSMDAYHYFGTDDLYLSYLAPFLRAGGRIGIVVPGFVREVEELPEHLAPYWDPALWSFHTPAWWRRHWERSELVAVTHADNLPGGSRDWEAWLAATVAANPAVQEHEMVRVDAGRTLGFTRVVATRT